MTEIKYTSDGKKVVVIGKLNSTETIVQEIFITKDGAEIPAGENFLVKSLLNAPAISWKESNLKEIDRLYETTYKDKEQRYNKLKKEMDLEASILRQKMNYIKSVVKNVKPESFDLLTDYITGEITHILYIPDNYISSDTKILTIKEFCEIFDGKLRLVSIFGKDDGTLTYAINDYSDYSGRNRGFIPCKSFNEAKLKLIEMITNKEITSTIIDLAKKYNIQLDSEKVKKYNLEALERFDSSIERMKNDIAILEIKKEELLQQQIQ